MEPNKPQPSTRHYLKAQYVSERNDGFHIEARCTCGEKFEGVGGSKAAAIEALWQKFKEHCGECF